MTHKLTQDEVEKVHVLNTGGKNPPPSKKKMAVGVVGLMRVPQLLI